MEGSIWHTDLLSEFNEELYHDVFTTDNIASNEISKRYQEQEFFGYLLERENHKTKVKERYFMPTDFLGSLPIRVTSKEKFSFKGEVLYFIRKCESCKIPSIKAMSFKELWDFFANYKHSEPDHHKLSRLVTLVGYIERINLRIVSEASFGKDGMVDILQLTNGGVVNLYNATLAKLKFALKNHLIIINELGGLKSDEIGSLQVYLTQAGAYKASYQNNSRSTHGTKETMNLMATSHLIFHNTPEYYVSKGQRYFEEMFTPAIMDRFPALLMKGYVQEDFTVSPRIEDVPIEIKNKIKHFISTLNYYKANPLKKAKYEVDRSFWGFKGKELQRALRGFKTLTKYLAEACESEEEFIRYCTILKDCRFDYLKLISGLETLNLGEY